MSPNRVNLNELAPRASGDFDWQRQDRATASGPVTVHFGDVATAAEQFIRDSPMLVGCVAWIRSRRLVEALAARPVAIVVNKEFGLRVEGHPEREALAPLTGGVLSRHIPIPRAASWSSGPLHAGWDTFEWWPRAAPFPQFAARGRPPRRRYTVLDMSNNRIGT